MAVVTAIMALLVVLGLPAVRVMLDSLESKGGANSMISAALASARAIAATSQRYAGVRFQPDANGNQYMIFIIHDPAILASGFRAAEGIEPIKLPEAIGVMDMMVRTNHGVTPAACEDVTDEPLKQVYLDDGRPGNLDADGKNIYLTDARTFSIMFSPAGRLLRHRVRVRNHDGIYRPDNGVAGKLSLDKIFSSPVNVVTHGIGMFVQDDYADLGLGEEWSRNGFVIYDKKRLAELDAASRLSYLNSLIFIHINLYTGTMILPEQ